MKKTSSLALFIALAALAPSAPAAYIVTMQEAGSNVVALGTGSINLAGLTAGTGARPLGAAVEAATALLRVGAVTRVFPNDPNDQGFLFSWTGISGPMSFGSGTPLTPASAATGLFVGLSGGATNPGFLLPAMYQSNTPFGPSSATWTNASFASLGLTQGTYVWNWGSGSDADTYTLQIGLGTLPVPEPGTWALLAVGLALGSLLRARQSLAR